MNSIRLRLLLPLMAMLAVAGLVVGSVTYGNVLRESHELFDYQLRQMALSLRDQGEIAPDQASALADESLDFVIQIWTVDGRTIYSSRPHPALPARALLGLADVTVQGQTWRTFSVATRDRVIQVAQPEQIRERLAVRAALRSVVPLALLAPLMALALWWLVDRSLAPLRRVAGEVRQRDAGTLAPLPADHLPDEVAPLVAALNALLARLGRSIDTQRAFVADAAHELRSPLTALTLQMRLLQRAPDEAARAQAIDALSAGIARSTRLVEQLLTLARSEPGAPGATLRPLDLAEAVREAVAETMPLALSRGVDLELKADEPVNVTGDRPALVALARNLVDNAARYSPPGSRVQVCVGAGEAGPCLQVDDSGPGIPAQDRERVFDRFYRRPSGEETSGSGLGLAIVRSIAERHGGRVALGDSPLGGLRVSVQFAEPPATPTATATATPG